VHHPDFNFGYCLVTVFYFSFFDFFHCHFCSLPQYACFYTWSVFPVWKKQVCNIYSFVSYCTVSTISNWARRQVLIQLELTPFSSNFGKAEGIQELVRFLLNPMIHYFVHKIPPPVHNLSQRNPITLLPNYFTKTHFNIILPSTPNVSSVSFRVSNKHFIHIFHIRARYLPCPSHPPCVAGINLQYKLLSSYIIMPPVPSSLLDLNINLSNSSHTTQSQRTSFTPIQNNGLSYNFLYINFYVFI
jgi:hypothetical protein